MKILFVMPNGFYARNFASVIDALGRSGHKVLVALETGLADKPSAANVLKSYLGARHDDRVEIIQLPERRPPLLWGATSRQVAALWDYSRYLLPLHRHARRCARRAGSMLLAPMRFLNLVPERGRDWAARITAEVCAWIQEIMPPDRSILRAIRAHDPDVVLITPLIDLGSDQTDYVKACRRLRIPIGHCVASWDNLTNKGLIKARPDRVFVWNEAQKTEAVGLHNVPENRVSVTGAQIFDHWFEAKPTLDWTSFCAKAGLDPSKLILLYTASSIFICRNEVEFVLKWLGALRRCADTRLREAGVLIRPHPKAKKTMAQWDHPDLKAFNNVVVFPKGTELSLERQARDDYYNSLYHSAAVVGINTSAMLEASIVGRRSFTILLDEVREGQDGMVHFQHLTRDGFLGVAHSFDEHIEQLRDELDKKDGRTQAFVKSFLRPYGVDRPATPIFIAEVEEMGKLTVEGPSLCARLGWIQRPLLLPLAAIVGIASVAKSLGRTMRPSRNLRKVYGALRRTANAVRFRVGVALRQLGLLPQRPVLSLAADNDNTANKPEPACAPNLRPSSTREAR